MPLKQIAVAAISFLALGVAAHAAEPLIDEKSVPGKFSANVSLTNEYVFRGISQTDDAPALQGGIDYEHNVGFYAGVWGSNVDFNDGEDGATVEIDLYAGFGGDIKGVSWKLGGIYYTYPGADDQLNYDFVEAAVSLGYGIGPVGTTIGVNYSPDYFAASGAAVYLYGDIEISLGKHFALGLHVGHQSIEKNDVFGSPDYIDYKVGIDTNVAGFGLNLAWSDTDHNDNECSDACGQILLTVSRSF